MQYQQFLGNELYSYLEKNLVPALNGNVPPLRELPHTGDRGLETPEALAFLSELYERVRLPLQKLLEQRQKDRDFIDSRTRSCVGFNDQCGIDFTHPHYQTILGHKDSQNRVVIGPLRTDYAQNHPGTQVAPLPDFLKGSHVTLFGPPDDAKMSINAMNAFHRRHAQEPAIVEELLKSVHTAAKWGADDEDSKTPIRKDLIAAGRHLTESFEKTLQFTDPVSKKEYRLAQDHLVQPIKRFPGLALPSLFLFWNHEPIPLHLYDFALHLFHHALRPEALCFYVPKLENEEEAAYIHLMVASAEELIKKRFPKYQTGSVRLMIVLENPRAVFRVHEIVQALHPYFAGASLGWHDYLASTARLFKNDPNYRIPVKADPNIVIRCIQASHRLLNDVVGPAGGIKVGGMYGVLPVDNDRLSPSYQWTLVGFFKDVITQLKRGLDGFWVAHPDFVRLGLAIVEAWKLAQNGDSKSIQDLIQQTFAPEHAQTVLDFLNGDDIRGFDLGDPMYPRYLIVAHSKESVFVPNHDLEEVRYNVFQSLQYLTDWLSGNGCVALPAWINNTPVRVMDDLATAERSRWEVWHEVHHGRVSKMDLIRIAHEELRFIRKNEEHATKKVQVKWNSHTSKWYPVALELMLQLMTSSSPPEFATELLLPFTLDEVQHSNVPLDTARKLFPNKFVLEHEVQSLHEAFDCCGCTAFATNLSRAPIWTEALVSELIQNFSLSEVIEAASFHGNIGESATTLDPTAAREQKDVATSEASIRSELKSLGDLYWKTIGFKFLVSAAGKTGPELLTLLKQRIQNKRETELAAAKEALVEITLKRMRSRGFFTAFEDLSMLFERSQLPSLQFSVCQPGHPPQTLAWSKTPGQPREWIYPIASLSKTFATAFALDQLRAHGWTPEASVNAILSTTDSTYRINSDAVLVKHLVNHQAMNHHYVPGISLDHPRIEASQLLSGKPEWGYQKVELAHPPGIQFQYSGGGFLVLEHLLEAVTGKSIFDSTREFLNQLGLQKSTFDPKTPPKSQSGVDLQVALGYLDSGQALPQGRLQFPSFAAGMLSHSCDVLKFLQSLEAAFYDRYSESPISHDTAIRMFASRDRSSRDFMGVNVGLGTFIAEAGTNRMAVHQGANDGYRALSLHTYSGPDRGKGFVILANQDDRAVFWIAAFARKLSEILNISGIQHSNEVLRAAEPQQNIPQEQRVNLGYKDLFFSLFEEDLPEPIVDRGPIDPLATYNLVVGGKILWTTDQRFARGENLISDRLPRFDPALYGREGKVMDSWESVRHNVMTRPGRSEPADELILSPGRIAPIRYVSFSTKYHLGNQTPAVRLEGKTTGGTWEVVLNRVLLEGHAQIKIDLQKNFGPYQQFRVSMLPDGGLSRMGLFDASLPQTERDQFQPLSSARCIPFDEKIPHPIKPLSLNFSEDVIHSLSSHLGRSHHEVDAASILLGAKVIRASNEHYGPAHQVLSPFPPIHMFDGFESARSRIPGHFEELWIQLAHPCRPHRIEVDFSYYRNNNPIALEIIGILSSSKAETPLVPQERVKEFAGNQKIWTLHPEKWIDQLKIRVFPDGGFHRLRIFTQDLKNTNLKA